MKNIPDFTAPQLHNEGFKGISLRDYFAAKAMQGILSQAANGSQTIPDEISGWAYIVADAMLKEREK